MKTKCSSFSVKVCVGERKKRGAGKWTLLFCVPHDQNPLGFGLADCQQLSNLTMCKSAINLFVFVFRFWGWAANSHVRSVVENLQMCISFDRISDRIFAPWRMMKRPSVQSSILFAAVHTLAESNGFIRAN